MNADYIKDYLDRAWHILPTSQSKTPLIPGGFKSASCDINKVTEWWMHTPDANIGIATGKVSNIWVLDIDIKNGKNGLQSLKDHLGSYFDIDPDRQLIAITPSGGLHIYYQYPKDIEVRCRTNILDGIDVRGDGGYVMAPPSVVSTNGELKCYQWNNLHLPIPITPDWAKKLLSLKKQPPGYPQRTKEQYSPRKALEGIPEGERDYELFRYACHLKGLGIPQYLACGFISEAASRCIPPFEKEMAISKILRAYEQGGAPQ